MCLIFLSQKPSTLTNKEIANKFNLLGKLLELHGENPFKTRSYTNAYLAIKKWPDPISTLSAPELAKIKGIGKAIQLKVLELINTGEMKTLKRYIDETPPGIIDMLGIKGFGPKKIKVVWQEMGIESIGELIYAINENRLVELKGFGAKTQQSLKEQLEYHVDSADKMHYAVAYRVATELVQLLQENHTQDRTEITGEVARKCNIISELQILTTVSESHISQLTDTAEALSLIDDTLYYKNLKVRFISTSIDDFYYDLAKHSSAEQFWQGLNLKKGKYSTEAEVFESNDLPFFIPEYREPENAEIQDTYPGSQNIIDNESILGCIHNHSTYSDGMQTIPEMLQAAIDAEYEYFVITDHSKSAFYANGLSVDRLYKQLDEIRDIDQQEDGIKLFSGIESDILSSGALDYEDAVLADLDVIVASIHSNLKMDEKKATTRLIKAIENPYTSILGHPTGRLLLSRPAYPIDHQKVIDACADNGVAIELNANPYRLDIDWRWIDYAINKEVLISINPDAHSIKGIADTAWGVASARKAALPVAYCLNAMDLDEFEEWLEEQHGKRPS